MDRDTFILFYLCNPEIRHKVLGHIKVEHFLSKIQKDIFGFFTKYGLNGSTIQFGEVVSHLSTVGHGEDVVNKIVNHMNGFTPQLDKESINKVINMFNELIKKMKLYSVISKIQDESAMNVHQVVNDIQKIEDIAIDNLNMIDYSDREYVETLLQSRIDKFKIIKSGFPFINNSLLYGGYKTSDLNMIVGAPGRGKTYLIINENVASIAQQKKVLHYATGDMTEYSLILRYLSRLSGYNTSYLLNNDNFRNTYEQYAQYFQYLRVICVPPYTHDVGQLYDALIRVRDTFQYDTFCVDYDLNIKTEDENMYLEGGHLYAKMKELTQSFGVVGFMLTQPKIQYWNEEIIPEEGASESSKKQHHVDVMITLGKKRRTLPVGKLALVKTREGICGEVPVAFELGKGLFAEISEEEYKATLANFKVR